MEHLHSRGRECGREQRRAASSPRRAPVPLPLPTASALRHRRRRDAQCPHMHRADLHPLHHRVHLRARGAGERAHTVAEISLEMQDTAPQGRSDGGASNRTDRVRARLWPHLASARWGRPPWAWPLELRREYIAAAMPPRHACQSKAHSNPNSRLLYFQALALCRCGGLGRGTRAPVPAQLPTRAEYQSSNFAIGFAPHNSAPAGEAHRSRTGCFRRLACLAVAELAGI